MKKALIEFYSENYETYLNRAKRTLGDHHHAEDAVQEAFENALRYSHTFNDKKSLEHWFNMVFLNTVRDYLSYIRNQGIVMELKIKDHPSFPSELVDKYKGVISKEIHEYDEDEKKRLILATYFLSGYGAKGTAILCECTESAIYNLSHRFRIHLESKYDK